MSINDGGVELDELIRDLGRPEAYDHPVDSVELRQTHISLLFFAGDRVYKIKKPFDLGFLDFSTLARRKQFCEEEVRLNRRLAPDEYLGVSNVTRDARGRLRMGGDGDPVEFAVCMRRLPADRMLDHLLERERVDGADIDRIVDVLVPFHNAAAGGSEVDQFGTPAAVRQRIERNLEELEAVVAGADDRGILKGHLLERIRVAQRRFMYNHANVLEQRASAGRIRDGHGDLHAANICLPDDRVVIYDCIEFSREFRCCDVACDLAFLAMDLGFRGRDDLRERLIGRYAELSGDCDLAALIPFYERHYAMVRAKVRTIESVEPENTPGQRADAKNAADRYALYAAASAASGSLVLMCGLPGAGKSWLAERMAPLLHGSLVQSDAIRKTLAGVDPSEHAASMLSTAHYTPEWTHRTYDAMRDRAREAINAGRTTIVDANFPAASLRRPFVDLAQSTGAPFAIVYVIADEVAVCRRLAAREHGGSSISDADRAVHESARRRFEPPDEVPAEQVVTIRSPADPFGATSEVVDRLLGAAV